MNCPIQRLLALLWLPVLLLVACADEQEPASPPPTLTPFPPDLYLGLSDSAAPLADLVKSPFQEAMARRPPIFLPGSDEILLNDLEQGVIEAAIVFHLPTASQLWFDPVALDGVVIITHPDVAVQDLTSSELRDILSGAVDNWSQVGGSDSAIQVLNREPGSGARQILEDRILHDARFTNLAQIASTDEFMRQQVAATPGAIGYTMMVSAGERSLLVDGHAATPDSVEDQSYPLTTPIYFVSLAEPTGPVRDFLAWLQSPDGQAELREKYGQVR
jgi:ABC-type phosphate transport system substrate-binding protein